MQQLSTALNCIDKESATCGPWSHDFGCIWQLRAFPLLRHNWVPRDSVMGGALPTLRLTSQAAWVLAEGDFHCLAAGKLGRSGGSSRVLGACLPPI